MGLETSLFLHPLPCPKRPTGGYNSGAMNKLAYGYLFFAFCVILPVTLVILDASATPAAQTKPLLVAANQGDRDLSIIDPVADKQLATVPEGGITGHEVATSPDGRTAYVPIYGNSGVGKPGTDGSEMVVIDIPSRQVTGKVDFGHGVRPHCPVYDRASGLLYVTTELDQTVTIIDPRTLKIVGTVPTGQKESHMLVITRNGRRGYTSNVGAGSVSVLDLPGRKTIAIIPISAEAQRIAISNDDKMVFTSDQTKPQLAVIDTATNKIKTWVPLPAVGYGTSPTPDGRYLLVAMPKANQLAVVDLASLKVVRTIDVPDDPVKVLARPDGKVAYVSCSRAKQVAVVDLSQWKVESLIDAGKGVDGLAWAAPALGAGVHNKLMRSPGPRPS
jgi:DNA-binding beta-propeller fold protein YncE